MKAIRACTDLKEVTPETVNTLIKRMNVHNAEKADCSKKVKIDIEFIAIGLISIPDEKELLTLMKKYEMKKLRNTGRSGATAKVTPLRLSKKQSYQKCRAYWYIN